jgi:hypothetical protein
MALAFEAEKDTKALREVKFAFDANRIGANQRRTTARIWTRQKNLLSGCNEIAILTTYEGGLHEE